jgi:predicted HTH transcriptional regulator
MEIRKQICSFANAEGGILILEVDEPGRYETGQRPRGRRESGAVQELSSMPVTEPKHAWCSAAT